MPVYKLCFQFQQKYSAWLPQLNGFDIQRVALVYCHYTKDLQISISLYKIGSFHIISELVSFFSFLIPKDWILLGDQNVLTKCSFQYVLHILSDSVSFNLVCFSQEVQFNDHLEVTLTFMFCVFGGSLFNMNMSWLYVEEGPKKAG